MEAARQRDAAIRVAVPEGDSPLRAAQWVVALGRREADTRGPIEVDKPAAGTRAVGIPVVGSSRAVDIQAAGIPAVDIRQARRGLVVAW